MAEVRIERQEDFERALRHFRLQCKREGIAREFKDRQYYEKPSQKRREKGKRKRKG